MRDRMKAEVERLRKAYGAVDHGPNFEWVIVRHVPSTGWNRTTTDVLLVISSGYPETPPDNFYVPQGLRPANGGSVGGFSPNGFNYNGATWDQFSWHPDVGWSPASKIEDGSNLLDVMREVERRLSEVN